MEQIEPGIWRVPMPFGESTALTNCYLLDDDRGVLVVDPGFDSEVNRVRLGEALGHIGRSVSDIREIWATHLHVDHAGLADWLYQRTAVPTTLGRADAEDVLTEAYHKRFSETVSEIGVLYGVPQTAYERLGNIRDIAVRHRVEAIQAAEHPRGPEFAGELLEVIATPGHTRGHLCFALPSSGLVFTGDHLLDQMRPGVGLGLVHDSDPIQDYLDSLQRLEAFDEFRAAPGHGDVFGPLRHRRERLIEVYRQRIDEVAHFAEPTSTVWEVASRLTWSSDWDSLHGARLRSALTQVSLLLRHLDFHESAG